MRTTPVPIVHVDAFWVVMTENGFLWYFVPPDGGPDGIKARVDRPLLEATRFDAATARGVAEGGSYLHNERWVAVPATKRYEAHPPGAGGSHFYTLASDAGEYLLMSGAPLDWRAVVGAAIRADASEPPDLQRVLRRLLALGLEVVRSPHYYHIGRRSEDATPPAA